MDPKLPFSSQTPPQFHAASSSSSSSPIFIPDYPLLPPALLDAMFPTPMPPTANPYNLLTLPIANPAAAAAPPLLINSMGSHLVPPPAAIPNRYLTAFDELLKSVPEPRSFTSFLNSNSAMFEHSMNPPFPPQCGAVPAAAPLPRSTLNSQNRELLGLQIPAADPFGGAAFGGLARLGLEHAPQGKFLGPKSSEHILLNSQEPTPKNKYSCEACRVQFGTSQALGGHMSSHSKLRRVPAASPMIQAAEASAAASGARWRRSRSISKKAIAKGKAVAAKKIAASTHANISTIHQSQIAISSDSRNVDQDKKKKAEENNIMNAAVTMSTKLPDEDDGFGDIIDQLWLYDGLDMDDFSSLFDN